MLEKDLQKLGIFNFNHLYRNLSPPELIELSLQMEKTELSDTGALSVNTGKYTGRSPNDRFIVDDDYTHEHINWGNINKSITREHFDYLYLLLVSYLQNKDIFVFDGFVGNDPDYRVPLRIINDLPSQNLASRNLFIRPSEEELKDFRPEFNVICAPDFHGDPERDNVNSEAYIILDLKRKLIVIAGSSYTGEIKKAVFSAMNYLLPFRDVFPMHCSANTDSEGNTALFFGLSGTGKTTLSADPERKLIGDDEHGWSDNGIFNFEGGCYAKTINLDKEKEPQIYNAVRFGTLIENIVLDPVTRKPDYTDDKYTQNTRAAYPIEYIPDAVLSGIGGHPSTVIFLTADAFGVLPPISRLTPEQAMYQFVLGYTSKLAGTERGIVEPQMTFSMCFGAPFMMLHPEQYARMLKKKINEHKTDVYLVNTGWSGGPYGTGSRIDLPYTRSMVGAAVNGVFRDIEFAEEDFFGLHIPLECPDVPSDILNPRNTWEDKEAYDKKAEFLAGQFEEQMNKLNVSFE
ncbi:MAG: phosphoenolpyruvate carboxykinase (ATP) [bacterium]